MTEYKTLSHDEILKLSDQELIDHMRSLNETVDQQYFALEKEFDRRKVDLDKLRHPSPEPKDFKLFDIVHGRKLELGVIVAGPIQIPCYDSNVIDFSLSSKPLDIQNPESWTSIFESYIVFDLIEQEYTVCGTYGIEKLNGDKYTAYIPYDYAADKLRVILGLLKLSDQWGNSNKTEDLIDKMTKP